MLPSLPNPLSTDRACRGEEKPFSRRKGNENGSGSDTLEAILLLAESFKGLGEPSPNLAFLLIEAPVLSLFFCLVPGLYRPEVEKNRLWEWVNHESVMVDNHFRML